VLRLSAIFEAIDRITAPVKKMTGAVSGLGKTVEAVSPEAAKAHDETGKLADSMNKASEAIKKVTAAAAPLPANLDHTADAAKDAGKEVATAGDKANATKVKFGALAQSKLIGFFKTLGVAAFASVAGIAAATTAIVGLIGVGAAFVSGQARVAAAIGRSAKQAGISTDSYQRLSYAYQSVSLDQDAVSSSLKNLQAKMFGVVQGNKQSETLFRSLKISVRDANGHLKSADTVLGLVADRFAKMKDGATKATLAQMLFGETGADLIPLLDKGSAGLKGIGDQAQKLGLILSNDVITQSQTLRDKLNNLTSGLTGTKNSIWTGLLPSVIRLVEWFQKLLDQNHDKIVEGISKALGWLQNNLPTIISFLQAVFNTVTQIVGLVSGIAAFVGGWQNLINLGIAAVIAGIAAAVTDFAVTLGIAAAALFGLDLAAAPILLIVAAVAALAAGAFLLWRNWDKVVTWFKGALDWLGNALDSLPLPLRLLALPLWIITKWRPITEFFGGLFNRLATIWDGLPTWAQAFISLPLTIITHWNGIWSWFKGFFGRLNSAWNGLPAWAQAFISLPLTIISHWHDVESGIKGVLGRIGSSFIGFWNTIPPGVRSLLTGTARFVLGTAVVPNGPLGQATSERGSIGSSQNAAGRPQIATPATRPQRVEGQFDFTFAGDGQPRLKRAQTNSDAIDFNFGRGLQGGGF
jgi:uncharacterized protein YoxC